ncbi:MAG: murein biosynthesis integral membrane protein MurJ [Candidatus Omnitrophica bacterium]|jgi:putative peptidoglycan lipid II flippase|nr:murein biosynthesis integral membrane protein MurJ [Candidatus Omnitrophota bacterium]
MFKKIIKHTSIMTAGTLVSRILGFFRYILIANVFGTSDVYEAFLVAFRLPNIFRSIFAEGFTDSVATPVMSEYHGDKEKIFEIGQRLLCIFSIALSLFTILGIVFSRELVMVTAPGYIANLYKFNLAVSFTRITFFYLLLIGFSSVMVSMLYSLKKFFVPAFNPVFLNITFILGLLFFSSYFKNYILVACVIVAGILELLFPLIALKKNGFTFKFDIKVSLADPVLRKMLKLFLPRIWASVVYQLNVFVDTIFASFTQITGVGALAAIDYANRLVQLPFALIVLSITPVVVVDLSKHHKDGNVEDFKKLLVFSFQNVIFFVVPIASLFIFLPKALIDVLFKRGEFGIYSLGITSSVLFFYAFGVLFFCVNRLLVTSFYALKDTRTPAKIATIALLINATLSAILMFPLKIGGVALATSISAAISCFLLYASLIKRIGKINWADTKEQAFKVILLSFFIVLLCSLVWANLSYNKYFKTLIIAGLSSVTFLGLGFIFKLKQVIYLKQWILKKR